jgi:HD superfamily phosphodiesterase
MVLHIFFIISKRRRRYKSGNFRSDSSCSILTWNLTDLMKTDSGKKEAEKRTRFMELFVGQLAAEVNRSENK